MDIAIVGLRDVGWSDTWVLPSLSILSSPIIIVPDLGTRRNIRTTAHKHLHLWLFQWEIPRLEHD